MRPSRSKRYFFAGHAVVSIFSSLSLSLFRFHRFLHQKHRPLHVDLWYFRATRKESAVNDRSCNEIREYWYHLFFSPRIFNDSLRIHRVVLYRVIAIDIYIHIYRRCVSPISSFSGIVPRTVGRAIEIDAFFPSTNSLVRLNRRLMEIDLMVNAFSGGPSVFKQRDGKSIA